MFAMIDEEKSNAKYSIDKRYGYPIFASSLVQNYKGKERESVKERERNVAIDACIVSQVRPFCCTVVRYNYQISLFF